MVRRVSSSSFQQISEPLHEPLLLGAWRAWKLLKEAKFSPWWDRYCANEPNEAGTPSSNEEEGVAGGRRRLRRSKRIRGKRARSLSTNGRPKKPRRRVVVDVCDAASAASTASSSLSSSASTSSSSSRLKLKAKATKKKAAIVSPGVSDLKSGRHNIMMRLAPLLRRLMEHRRNSGMFNFPVDADKLGLTNYFEVIDRPMDLGTIKRKFDNRIYSDTAQFAADVRLVFENAMEYNAESLAVWKNARFLLKMFETEYSKMRLKMVEETISRSQHSCTECKGKSCALCGFGCLDVHVPSIRCSFPCKAKIPRNGAYYRLGDEKGQYWCEGCYKRLPANVTCLSGKVVAKTDIRKHYHNKLYKETWAKCRRCKKDFHDVCVLKVPGKPFACNECVPKKLAPSAQGLIRTHLDAFLEARVKRAVRRHLSNECLDDTFDVDAVIDSLTVRVVSNVKKPCDVFGNLKAWYEAQSADEGTALPTMSYSYRSKAIAVFQKIHDVDVLAFVLYAQEYGTDNPPPNRSKVYISYLDSVSYITPKCARTEIYQEVLASYLEWSSFRGFEEAFIWACPPQRGDAYVMHCHPKWQRTPSAERLRKWYLDVMKRCRCVSLWGNAYEDFFKAFAPVRRTRHTPHVKPNAENKVAKSKKFESALTRVPYLYGDFVPAEIQRILYAAENNPEDCIGRWWRQIKRSETLSAPVASVQERTDWLMRKLSAKIFPMKDNFIKFKLERKRSHSQPAMLRRLKADTSDPDSPMAPSILDDRLLFLDWCQTNRLQFDQLRRSKYSSAMIIRKLSEDRH